MRFPGEVGVAAYKFTFRLVLGCWNRFTRLTPGACEKLTIFQEHSFDCDPAAQDKTQHTASTHIYGIAATPSLSRLPFAVSSGYTCGSG